MWQCQMWWDRNINKTHFASYSHTHIQCAYTHVTYSPGTHTHALSLSPYTLQHNVHTHTYHFLHAHEPCPSWHWPSWSGPWFCLVCLSWVHPESRTTGTTSAENFTLLCLTCTPLCISFITGLQPCCTTLHLMYSWPSAQQHSSLYLIYNWPWGMLPLYIWLLYIWFTTGLQTYCITLCLIYNWPSDMLHNSTSHLQLAFSHVAQLYLIYSQQT